MDVDKLRKKFLKNQLRRAWLKWPPRSEALKRAKIRVQEGFFKNGNPKYRVYCRCARCEALFGLKEVEVDHIKPVGGLDDEGVYTRRMLCDASNLQVLCKPCHKSK